MRVVEFGVRWAGCLLALFITANFVGERFRPGFAADWIWIGNRGLPSAVHLALAAGLFWAGLAPPVGVRSRAVLASVFATYAVLTAADGLAYYELLARGRITSSAIVCLSEILGAILFLEAWLLFLPEPVGIPRALSRSWLAAPAAVAIALAAPLLHFATYGPTDYRREADCAIVPGAKVYRDRTPSLALEDRLGTALELYEEGRVGTLVVSGATGREGHNEAEVMRDWLVARGVPPERILVDPEGASTAATVDNTKRILEERGFESALVVSQGYHNARVQLAYRRAGVRVYTVPARETRPLVRYPYLLARECAAFYAYYLRE